jgi:predicted metal-dependent hydrolase
MEVRPGGIRVVVPPRCPAATVDAFIAEQSAWIEARTAVWREFAPPGEGPVDPVLPILEPEVGGGLWDGLEAPRRGSRWIVFRGRRTRLTIVETEAHRARLSWAPEAGIQLQLPRRWPTPRRDALAGRALARWYDGILREEATRIVGEVGEPRGLTPSVIRFSQPRARWGSCAGDGTIRLNRRLIGAPAAVFRSVVIHELAHLRHRNHGRDFWALVGEMDAGWGEARAWLRRYGVTLG